MQLTILKNKKNRLEKKSEHKSIFRRSCDWKVLCAVSALALSSIAEGAPKYFSQIKDGLVESKYSHEKRFTFSRDENDKIIKSILEKLPLAKSANIVSSSIPFKSADYKSESLGYVQRNIKQVHLVAVSFARPDLIPMMYFQVKEDWKDCEPEGDYCLENVALEISGPNKLVRDLNDFGAFPKSLNVMKMKVTLTNQSLSSFSGDSSPATVDWEMGFREVENGVEDYLRYFRSKAPQSEHRITLQNVRAAMALWAAQVSKSTFKNL